MVDWNNISGSYNGSTPGSEPDNRGSIPLPEADRYGYSISKWTEQDDDLGIITPFFGRGK